MLKRYLKYPLTKGQKTRYGLPIVCISWFVLEYPSKLNICTTSILSLISDENLWLLN